MIEDGTGVRGRTAIVTGAAHGLGAACAKRLHAAGARVVAVDESFEEAQGVLAGLDEVRLGGDVADPDLAARAVETALREFGSVDILVNVAGTLAPTRFLDIPLAEWTRIVGVNLTGAFMMSQAAARPMADQGWGRIVHFSSTAGKTVSTLGGAHYTASKHAVLGLVRASAKELAPFGVTVNAVCPGLVNTEGARSLLGLEELERIAGSFPVPRLCDPAEVAELVHFLVQPTAGYITGAALDINGGDLLV